MSKKTYIHRNVNMMLYSLHMSKQMCWHKNFEKQNAQLQCWELFLKKDVDFEK